MIFNGKYYYIVVGLFILMLYPINLTFKIIPEEFSWCIFLFAIACFTVKKDIKLDTTIKSFLRSALPFSVLVMVILIGGNAFWHGVLKLEVQNKFMINLNALFESIPLNDGGFARIFQPEILTTYMKMVYNTGFVLAVLVPLFRATLATDFKKMLKYTLSSHVFQVFIITPFYFVFYLREVWVVNGHIDVLGRNLVGNELLETTLNCLPSMHTSIAFAMFILVLREKDRVFKYIWGFYCLSVIYSTMYLEVHWVLDVFGGLILGYFTVKLTDWVIASYYDKYIYGIQNLFNRKSTTTITSEIE